MDYVWSNRNPINHLPLNQFREVIVLFVYSVHASQLECSILHVGLTAYMFYSTLGGGGSFTWLGLRGDYSLGFKSSKFTNLGQRLNSNSEHQIIRLSLKQIPIDRVGVGIASEIATATPIQRLGGCEGVFVVRFAVCASPATQNALHGHFCVILFGWPVGLHEGKVPGQRDAIGS